MFTSQMVYMLLMFSAFGAYWYWQSKKLKAAGGVAGVMEAADREAFGLTEGEAIAKRWNAAFYLGTLVPETLPSLGEKVASFFASESLRGRHVRIGLTTGNRIVFSVEPEPHEPRPGTVATQLDPSKALSKGFLPAAVITPGSAPKVTDGEQLYGQHEAWHETIKSAPDAMLNSSNWQAPVRRMKLARLDGMPGGRPWILWVDPEALQFLSNYGVP